MIECHFGLRPAFFLHADHTELRGRQVVFADHGVRGFQICATNEYILFEQSLRGRGRTCVNDKFRRLFA
jgi:hypothetical protein